MCKWILISEQKPPVGTEVILLVARNGRTKYDLATAKKSAFVSELYHYAAPKYERVLRNIFEVYASGWVVPAWAIIEPYNQMSDNEAQKQIVIQDN